MTNAYGSVASSNATLTVNPTPVISGFSPATATVGTTVRISGTNFSPVAANNTVYFGAVQAAVTSASVTNLTMTVPVGATFAPITVTVNGLTAYADQPFLPTFQGVGQINSSSLATRLDLPTGSGPLQTVIADLDGDGKPDLIVGDAYGGEISIYRNISTNGSLTAGSFASRVILPGITGTYDNPYSIAVADLDGDSRLDIIAINADSNVVSIYRNISSPGTLTTNSFATRIDLSGGNTMRGLAVQDLNGDGLPEIVTANAGDNTISVYQNLSTVGNIAFATRVNFATASGPQGLAIGDLDGDGNPDVAVTCSGGTPTVSVFRNLGTGGNIMANSLASHVDFPALPSVFPIAIGDVDGDGKLDLVVGISQSSDAILVYRNTSTVGSITTNSFAAPVRFAAPGWVNSVALADLDGDGKLDIALSTQQSGNYFSIFKNISSPGSFTTASLASRVDYSAGNNPSGISIGDLDGDGRPDIVFANTYGNTISIYRNLVPFSSPPTITTQPTNQTVNAGSTAIFSVVASGTAPLSYQWSFNTTNIVGATNATLTLASVQPANGGTYAVTVTNAYGSVASSNATLTVLVYPPTITTQPQSQTNVIGSAASFAVVASGTAPLSYQWSLNTTNIVGATNATLTLNNVQLTDGGVYAVTVTNAYGSVASSNATLTVTLPPTITQQPQSQSALSYNSASFTVAATGTGPLSYHWRKNGTNLVDGGNISGSTTANLNLAVVSVADAGNYYVVITNLYGMTNSAVAVLTVPQTMLTLVSTNAMSGGTVIVSILMNALGVENALQASVGYDPTKLVLQSVQPGPALSRAYLQEVDSQTNNGYVGFAILLNDGVTQAAGTNEEVVDLVFSTLPVTNNTAVNLTFGDTPTFRQVVDNNLDSLPAIYQNASVTLTPAEYEADVYPRTNGDNQLNIQDWVEVGRMVAGLDVPTNSDEMLRADCAPRNAPDGVLTVADWVQAGRYELGLDPLTVVGQTQTPKLAPVPHGGQIATRTLQIGSVAAQRGQTVSVSVQLVCTTNENAVGITVGYDKNRLKFMSASLGSSVGFGARMNINTNSAAGEVGVALALSPGQALTAGTNQVVVLQFAAATNASGAVALSLNNSVVLLQVADKMANVLSTMYVDGAVVLPPQPTLTTVTTGANMQLTWPISTNIYQVLSADSPQGPWTNSALPIITNGVNATVTVPLTNQQQYFRLMGN